MPNLIANWLAPANITALTTTRQSGLSQDFYAHNNLAFHVHDNPEHVEANRRALRESLSLPAEPAWLEQTHSTDCIVVEEESLRNADAAITRQKNTPLAIMTADCLPILLCDIQGTEIAAIHAGWRGLRNGIIENTLAKMHNSSNDLMAWIGPAICSECYETGDEVKKAFLERYAYVDHAFYNKGGKIHANLPHMAELILRELGVNSIYQSNACTFELENKFYSYRRAAQTGRMATLIWLK